jgi:hypothetical protein
VSMRSVFEVLERMVDTVRDVIRTVTDLVPLRRGCDCAGSEVPDFPG